MASISTSATTTDIAAVPRQHQRFMADAGSRSRQAFGRIDRLGRIIAAMCDVGGSIKTANRAGRPVYIGHIRTPRQLRGQRALVFR